MTPSEEYWDLGDDFDNPVRMSDKSLGNVLRCLIKLRGAMLSSYEANGHYKNPNMNNVLLRIRLPVGKREEFETMSGLKLSVPPRINGA